MATWSTKANQKKELGLVCLLVDGLNQIGLYIGLLGMVLGAHARNGDRWIKVMASRLKEQNGLGKRADCGQMKFRKNLLWSW